MSLSTRKEEFKHWVKHIPELIEYNLKNLPEEFSSELDYSLVSLKSIESYILNKFDSTTMFNDENKLHFDFIARYIGETYRRNLPDSHWEIHLEDKNHIFYGLPVITGSPLQKVDYCPYSLVVACLEDKEGSYLINTLIETVEKINS